jgi:hypothetical protein
MPRKPPPDEIRLRALGVTRLKPEESSYSPRVRAKKEVLAAFLELTPEERGAVVELGLRALSAEKRGDKP